MTSTTKWAVLNNPNIYTTNNIVCNGMLLYANYINNYLNDKLLFVFIFLFKGNLSVYVLFFIFMFIFCELFI